MFVEKLGHVMALLFLAFIFAGFMLRMWADFWACFDDIAKHKQAQQDPDTYTLQPSHIRAMFNE